MPLEMFLSLTGIILFTSIFQPEQNRELSDLVSAKYHGPKIIWLIRALYSAAAMLALICLFTGYLKARGCDVTPVLAFGTASDGLFLGSMGLLTSALANNTVIGYMPPLLYYALNIGMGPKLGSFYLFSMTSGEYGGKPWLLAVGFFMFTAAFACENVKKWMR